MHDNLGVHEPIDLRFESKHLARRQVLGIGIVNVFDKWICVCDLRIQITNTTYVRLDSPIDWANKLAYFVYNE